MSFTFGHVHPGIVNPSRPPPPPGYSSYSQRWADKEMHKEKTKFDLTRYIVYGIQAQGLW